MEDARAFLRAHVPPTTVLSMVKDEDLNKPEMFPFQAANDVLEGYISVFPDKMRENNFFWFMAELGADQNNAYFASLQKEIQKSNEAWEREVALLDKEGLSPEEYATRRQELDAAKLKDVVLDEQSNARIAEQILALDTHIDMKLMARALYGEHPLKALGEWVYQLIISNDARVSWTDSDEAAIAMGIIAMYGADREPSMTIARLEIPVTSRMVTEVIVRAPKESMALEFIKLYPVPPRTEALTPYTENMMDASLDRKWWKLVEKLLHLRSDVPLDTNVIIAASMETPIESELIIDVIGPPDDTDEYVRRLGRAALAIARFGNAAGVEWLEDKYPAVFTEGFWGGDGILPLLLESVNTENAETIGAILDVSDALYPFQEKQEDIATILAGLSSDYPRRSEHRTTYGVLASRYQGLAVGFPEQPPIEAAAMFGDAVALEILLNEFPLTSDEDRLQILTLVLIAQRNSTESYTAIFAASSDLLTSWIVNKDYSFINNRIPETRRQLFDTLPRAFLVAVVANGDAALIQGDLFSEDIEADGNALRNAIMNRIQVSIKRIFKEVADGVSSPYFLSEKILIRELLGEHFAKLKDVDNKDVVIANRITETFTSQIIADAAIINDISILEDAIPSLNFLGITAILSGNTFAFTRDPLTLSTTSSKPITAETVVQEAKFPIIAYTQVNRYAPVPQWLRDLVPGPPVFKKLRTNAIVSAAKRSASKGEKYLVRRIGDTNDFQLLGSDDDVVGTASAAIDKGNLTLFSVQIDEDVQSEKLCTAFVTSVLRKVLGNQALPLYGRASINAVYHGAPNTCYINAFAAIGYRVDPKSNLPFIFKRIDKPVPKVVSIGADALGRELLSRFVVDDIDVRSSSKITFIHTPTGVEVETDQQTKLYEIAHSIDDFDNLTRDEKFVAGMRNAIARLYGSSLDEIAVDAGATIITFTLRPYVEDVL